MTRLHTRAMLEFCMVAGWPVNAGDLNYITVGPSGSHIKAVSAGTNSLYLTTDGSLIEIGTLDNISDATLVSAPSGKGYKYISAGKNDWGLAIKSDGSIVQWGHNRPTDSVLGSNPPSGNDYVAVAAGMAFGIALKTDGSLVVWGNDSDNQKTNKPTSGVFTAIAAGEKHGIALKDDGTLVGWGYNASGDGYPATVPSGNTYVAIACGWRHNLALKADGSIVGWGTNSYGESTPPSGNSFIEIACGYLHSLALRANGSIRGWGAGYGALVKPSTGTGYSAIAAGVGFGLALKVNTISAWATAGSPMLTFSGYAFDKMAAGVAHAIARKTDGSLYGWGDNTYGQTTCPAGADYLEISAGKQHSIALETVAGYESGYGKIVGWGDDSVGQIDCPPLSDSLGPIQYKGISAGWYHGLALKYHATQPCSVVGWGLNDSGQITLPPYVLNVNDFIAVTAGEAHSVALKTDGSIICWGDNSYGQLGCPSGTGYTSIKAGRRHTIALAADGSIVGWGDNSNGQIDCPAGTGYIVIAAGGDTSLALKADGTIIQWGDDGGGGAIVPKGNNFKAVAAGHYQALALTSVYPVRAAFYDRRQQKQSSIKIAKCVPYNGSISVTFSGIIMSPTWNGNSWADMGIPVPDPNQTFIVPRRDSWDTDPDTGFPYVWQTKSNYPPALVPWLVYFTYGDHYIAARYPNSIGPCGQLILSLNFNWFYANYGWPLAGVVFETHSHGKESYTTRPLQGSQAVDVCSRRRSFLPGRGPFKDRISTRIENIIIAKDADAPPGTGYSGLDGAMGFGGYAVIDGGGLFYDEMPS